MGKPREFWLDIATPYGDPCYFIHDEDPYVYAKRTKTNLLISATNIHVIEKSAYDAVLAREAKLVEILKSIKTQYESVYFKNMIPCGALDKCFYEDTIDALEEYRKARE